MTTFDTPLVLNGIEYTSRLLVGTGRYKDMAETKAAIEASGAEIITVAVRRVDAATQAALWEALPPVSSLQSPVSRHQSSGCSTELPTEQKQKRFTYLPNTAGCYSAEDAIRLLRLAREAGGGNLVKLEVIGDPQTLYPNVMETLKAAEILVKEGFAVMAYTTDDLIVAKELEKIGCAAVMPLAAPIGSGLGLLNPYNIQLIAETLRVPVLVDAGIGTPSDAARAMELGCAGVLLNTAIAEAKHPVVMAAAFKQAVIAGRLAFLAGRMPKRDRAVASSPAI
jgi:thiazole synthase